MSKLDYYYVVFGGGFAIFPLMPRHKVVLLSSQQIVDMALSELSQCGSSIYQLAGVPFSHDENGAILPERVLTKDEMFDLSIQKLNDRHRMFSVFCNSLDGIFDFLACCRRYNIEDAGLKLIAI